MAVAGPSAAHHQLSYGSFTNSASPPAVMRYIECFARPSPGVSHVTESTCFDSSHYTPGSASSMFSRQLEILRCRVSLGAA